jgi:hypothetical protein
MEKLLLRQMRRNPARSVRIPPDKRDGRCVDLPRSSSRIVSVFSSPFSPSTHSFQYYLRLWLAASAHSLNVMAADND